MRGLDGVELARHVERDEIARGHARHLEEALLAHPLVVVHLGEVARAVVVEDHDDHVVACEAVGKLQQPGHRRAGRVPREDPLLASQAARHDRGVLVGDLLEVIDDAEVDVLGQEVLADPFGDVGVDLVLVEDAGLLVLLEDGPVCVDPPHANRRVALLEVASDAAGGAAGPDAHHELRHPAVGLLPDLRRRPFVMGRGIREVVVLVGLPGVGDLVLEPRRYGVVRPRVLGIDVGRADDHLGAKRLERVGLLLRLLVGRREDALVALHDRRDRQAHPGVARRAFDDGAAGPELAAALGVFDHPHGHPVLDRVAGIEGLDLGEDRRVRHAAGDAVDAHQGRIADGVEDGVADLRAGMIRHVSLYLRTRWSLQPSASFNSAIRSSTDSTPTDSRTRLSLMPSFARMGAGSEACVMMPGCSMRLSTPPRLSASAKR